MLLVSDNVFSSGRNVQELMSRFQFSNCDKETPPLSKARVSRQSSKDNMPTMTTSLDASSFPSDNPPLARVKTSPDLNQNQEPQQQKQVETSLDSEAVRRERIEKYKEERRTFLRKKYRTDSFNNNDDKDEEMIRRLKAKANVRSTESGEDNNSASGVDSLENMEWTIRRSPSRKKDSVGSNSELLAREKELESRLSEEKMDHKTKTSPSKTLVSISYSPTKSKAPGWETISSNASKSPEIERIPNKIAFSRSISLTSSPDSLKDTKSNKDKHLRRPEDLNLTRGCKKTNESFMSSNEKKSDKQVGKSNEESNSFEESLVQRRVNQLSSSLGEPVKHETENTSEKRRTSLTDVVKPQR